MKTEFTDFLKKIVCDKGQNNGKVSKNTNQQSQGERRTILKDVKLDSDILNEEI